MSSLTILGIIGLVGFLCQWLAAKARLPAILFLLLSGILLGPVFSVFNPNDLFGDLMFPFISLSVSVILFEGALTLRRNELKGIARPVRRMTGVGALINAAVMMVATYFLLGFSWSLSALFGALMVVTGPTVIMPMLKAVRPTTKVSDVLRWEGIIIDPIGALFAVLVFEWIAVQNAAAEVSEIFTVFAGTVATGMAVGLVAGYAFGLLLRHHLVPEKLHNFAALAFVCFVFAVSDNLMHESGLLAVTVMGILLANMKDVYIESILEFKEDLTVVFVSALFIVLAARLDLDAFLSLGWGALVLLLVMQFIARPLKVFFSFLGSDFSWREKVMISWIGPRGIVAAAVSSVFALRLTELGVDNAEKLVPLAFSIIIGTVVIQSLTARPIAKALDVAMPSTQGVLIVGANPFSISVAQALVKNDVQTVVCDTDWESLKNARNMGLETYYGNPSSEHAHLHLNLSPFGYMLGLSSHFEYNVSQANVFRDEFGVRNTFILPPNQSSKRFHKHLVSQHKSGRILFSEHMSYSEIKLRMREEHTIKVTELTDEYSLADWKDDNLDALIILVLQENGGIIFSATDNKLDTVADSGAKVFYLSDPNA